ncbi:MAG: hypothetical protein PHR45_05760 [Muribaculaceae bacterium]|nr:hypothetical protein [Muribaculaceae bacterium]
MNQQIKDLLAQVYELEGLLLLVENHGDNTGSLVYKLIQKKGAEIALLSQKVDNELFNKPESTINQQEVSENLETDEIRNNDFEMLGADSCCDCDNNDENQESPEEVYDEVIIENNDNLTAEEITNDDTIDIEPIADIEPALDDSEINSDDIKSEDNLNDTIINAEEESLIVDNDDDIIEEDDEENEPIRLDEILQRELSKNLKKAFTLNDRFRYRRELFENSDVQMTNTLNLVETMDSFSEAEDYFYNDLEWDKESSEVKDFMEIIKKHFA